MKKILVILAFKILNHYNINIDIKRGQIISIIGIPFRIKGIIYEVNEAGENKDSVEITAEQLKSW